MFGQRIELQEGLAERLKEIAERKGVTVQELVAHILLQYIEALDASEEGVEAEEEEA